MKVKIGDYIQVKTKKEMSIHKGIYERYTDTTSCGWDDIMKPVLGARAKISHITERGNYKIKGFEYYISPDWCKNTKTISFKSLYKEIV